ncbi:MAG: hypothetical protein SPI60_07105, partial [Campylobacter lanienae]|nr:hypothetical protein [Campylobacter lanienae]
LSAIAAAIQQAEQTRQQSTQSSVFSAIAAAIQQQVVQESTQSTTTAQVVSEENEIKAKRQELINVIVAYRDKPQSLADRKIELSQNGDDDEYITL